ncbi:hypothetical protein BKA70DRAFT_1313431 [Coprinopsis sp. MPI-PUGE-AT-0042]|nr:hypothetical protein BKA70DRAFT_1313431 [Coprinopsis sp. MPI-PUGE-AT-0042]
MSAPKSPVQSSYDEPIGFFSNSSNYSLISKSSPGPGQRPVLSKADVSARPLATAGPFALRAKGGARSTASTPIAQSAPSESYPFPPVPNRALEHYALGAETNRVRFGNGSETVESGPVVESKQDASSENLPQSTLNMCNNPFLHKPEGGAPVQNQNNSLTAANCKITSDSSLVARGDLLVDQENPNSSRAQRNPFKPNLSVSVDERVSAVGRIEAGMDSPQFTSPDGRKAEALGVRAFLAKDTSNMSDGNMHSPLAQEPSW